MTPRYFLWTALVCLLVLGGAYGWSWMDPQRGLERRWDAVLEAIESGEWETFQGYLAADYKDGFGYDRDRVVVVGKSVFGRFEALSLTRQDSTVEVQGDVGVTSARIRIGGHGDPLALAIVQGSRAMPTTTTFRWRRLGRPWEWELVSVDDPDVASNVRRVERELNGL